MTVAMSKPTPIAVTVAATSTTVLAAAGGREYALFQNDSDEAIYIGIGAAAVMNSGIRLNANGGSYEMSRVFGNLSTEAIYAICTSGSKILCGIESKSG